MGILIFGECITCGPYSSAYGVGTANARFVLKAALHHSSVKSLSPLAPRFQDLSARSSQMYRHASLVSGYDHPCCLPMREEK